MLTLADAEARRQLVPRGAWLAFLSWRVAAVGAGGTLRDSFYSLGRLADMSSRVVPRRLRDLEDAGLLTVDLLDQDAVQFTIT